MGELTTIMARDGHEFQAYLAPRPGNRAERSSCCRRSSASTATSAPSPTALRPKATQQSPRASFDRVHRGIQLGYGPDDRQQAIGTMQQLKIDDTLKDVGAAIAVVKNSGRVGVRGLLLGRQAGVPGGS